jgi:hypothetical protein
MALPVQSQTITTSTHRPQSTATPYQAQQRGFAMRMMVILANLALSWLGIVLVTMGALVPIWILAKLFG